MPGTMPGMSRKSSSPVIRTTVAVAIAALAVDLSAAESRREFRLLPAGEFRSWDGRPTECAAWVMLDEDGERLVAEASARQSACVIDYDHQTLRAKDNGQAAVAAGWFKTLEWRSGDGLYVIDPDWTALAAQRIDDKEFRYISPVFGFDKKTGRVTHLYQAALTNFPAVDGLTDLAALAADIFSATPSTKETSMDEALMEQLRWLLNLPVGATADDIKAQLQKLIDQLGGKEVVAAASFDLATFLKAQGDQVVALNARLAAAPAPADPVGGTVPMAQFLQLQAELAALSGKVQSVEHAGLLEAALADGRILPHQADYWRGQPLAVLSGYVAAAKPMAALSGLQTGGAGPAGGNLSQTTDDDRAVMKALGLSAEQFAAGKL